MNDAAYEAWARRHIETTSWATLIGICCVAAFLLAKLAWCRWKGKRFEP